MSDVEFLVALQRRFSDAVGFLPRAALEEFVSNRRYFLARENAEECGAILWRPRMRCLPEAATIVAAMVCQDVQRREHGLGLVRQVCVEAAGAGRLFVQAWCAADLEAVEFWRAAGFAPIGVRNGGNRRSREVVLFRRSLLPGGKMSQRFLELPPVAGWKARRLVGESYGPLFAPSGQE